MQMSEIFFGILVYATKHGLNFKELDLTRPLFVSVLVLKLHWRRNPAKEGYHFFLPKNRSDADRVEEGVPCQLETTWREKLRNHHAHQKKQRKLHIEYVVRKSWSQKN